MRWRGQRKHVYHDCMRCGTRQPLSKLEWQDGKLVCRTNDCVDTHIVGDRDLAVARALTADRQELVPDPKLTQPSERKRDVAEVMF